MVRAMGPIAPSVAKGPTHGGRCPRPGIRPGVGLSEQMPVKWAGTRTEPPLSLPKPAAERPAEMAADSPPLDPPGVRSRSQGFTVRPTQPRHDFGVLTRNLALVDQATYLAFVACGGNRRLDRHRQAVKRPTALLERCCVHQEGLRAHPLGVEVGKGVQDRVELLDL